MLNAEHAVGLKVDDGGHEIAFIREVVVHLRGADGRRLLDVFDGGARDTTLQHQSGSGGHDALAGCTALRGQLVVRDRRHGDPFRGVDSHNLLFLELTLHSRLSMLNAIVY